MERLACSEAAAYLPIEAAIHVSRYAGALALCAGKRVLDVACGEGYGAYLMARAGAAEVVGIDASAEAVGAAATQFPHPRLRLLTGTAAALDELLGEAQFDLIVSLETIEHLGDPAGFLKAIRRRCAPGATVILSCPNDHWYYRPNEQNPYHVRKYNFAEFRSLAEECLGEADAWYFGTAAFGFTAVPLHGLPAGRTGMDYADAAHAPAAFLCRPGADDPVTPDCASYFLGAWGPGAAAAQGAAVFPLSMDRYASMVRASDPATLEATENAVREQLRAVEDQLASARQDHAAQMAGAESALDQSKQALGKAEARLAEAQQRADQDLRLARVQLHALRKENGILTESVARLQAERSQAAQLAAALAETQESLQASATRLQVLSAELDTQRGLHEALVATEAGLRQERDALHVAQAGLREERDFLLAERERIFARMRPVWRVAQLIPPPVRRGMRRVAGPVLRRLATQG